jgi:hypothetical protein
LEQVDWPEGTKAEVVAVRESQVRGACPEGDFERTAGALAGEKF